MQEDCKRMMHNDAGLDLTVSNTEENLNFTNLTSNSAFPNINYISQRVPLGDNTFTSEFIILSGSILYREKPKNYFEIRSKPAGCRTVLVGGVPQNATIELIKQIFERCGPLKNLFIPEIGYCYLIFHDESSAEKSLCFSGYRLKVGFQNEASYTGLLFVDYAAVNFEECELQNISVLNQNEGNYFRSGNLFDHAHNAPYCVCEKLNREDLFTEVVDMLMACLEDDVHENSTHFFSMIQCFQKHLIKSCNNIKRCEESIINKKKASVEHLKELISNLKIHETIYNLGLQEHHFTVVKKKSIELWQKDAKNLKSNIKRMINEFSREEKANKANVLFIKQLNDELQKLREDLRVLKYQCTMLKNNTKTMKFYFKDFERLDSYLAEIEMGIENDEKRNLTLKDMLSDCEIRINELRKIIQQSNNDHCNSEQLVDIGDSSNILTQQEACIISLVSIFLCSHQGATMDSIYSYLHENHLTVSYSILEKILQRFRSMFEQRIVVVGTTLKKEWYFIGFHAQ